MIRVLGKQRLGLAGMAVVGATTYAAMQPWRVVDGCDFPEEMRQVLVQGFPRIAGGVISDYATRSIAYMPGQRTLQIRTSELNPANGEWERVTYEYSTSFDITCISSNPGGRFVYVAGIKTDSSCEDIVEQWKFPRRTGGYEVYHEGPDPIGTPSGPFSAYVDIHGGEFVSQADVPPPGPRAPIPAKKTLIEGAYGHFDLLAVDPERRYLLLHSFEDHDVYQLPLTAPYAIGLVASGETYPHLSKVETMSVFDLPAGGGRFVHLSEQANGWTPIDAEDTIILDSDNDGVFESTTTYPFTEWQGSAFYDNSAWLNPFRVDYTEPN